MKNIFRVASMTAVAMAAATVSLLSAGSAQADARDCLEYLDRQGYPITEVIVHGCRVGETDQEICENILDAAGVVPRDARRACWLASQ